MPDGWAYPEDKPTPIRLIYLKPRFLRTDIEVLDWREGLFVLGRLEWADQVEW
jgi:hypothetical protein